MHSTGRDEKAVLIIASSMELRNATAGSIWQSEKVIRYCGANIETAVGRNCGLDLEVRNVLTMLLE